MSRISLGICPNEKLVDRAAASSRRALTVPAPRALALGLAGLRMAASMAPKRTTCDFGGSGTEKRKGCQFPLKNSARAHSVDAVLEAVHACVQRVLGDGRESVSARSAIS